MTTPWWAQTLEKDSWWPRSIVPLDRTCGTTTTFPVIKNYRDYLAGRISAMEYARRRAPIEGEVKPAPDEAS